MMRATSTICHATVSKSKFSIIGGGRVGLALSEMAGPDTLVVKRGESLSPDAPPGPIVVATRNDDLAAIVDATQAERRKDLVFIQNGMLQNWLDSRGLGDNTQVLVFFAVAKKGEKPTDGKTDLNPEGLTAAYGPHAAAVASLLHSGGLSCKVLDKIEFTKAMLEKLVWISAFMVIGAKHKVTVGEVERDHTQEVSRLITELATGGEKALGIRLDPQYVDRLLAYARSVAHFPTPVKEFPWRNGWFYDLSKKAGSVDPMPYHTSLLKELNVI
jgi:ketopantoate reductase